MGPDRAPWRTTVPTVCSSQGIHVDLVGDRAQRSVTQEEARGSGSGGKGRVDAMATETRNVIVAERGLGHCGWRLGGLSVWAWTPGW